MDPKQQQMETRNVPSVQRQSLLSVSLIFQQQLETQRPCAHLKSLPSFHTSPLKCPPYFGVTNENILGMWICDFNYFAATHGNKQPWYSTWFVLLVLQFMTPRITIFPKAFATRDMSLRYKLFFFPLYVIIHPRKAHYSCNLTHFFPPPEHY